jgi:hypothetical protein
MNISYPTVDLTIDFFRKWGLFIMVPQSCFTVTNFHLNESRQHTIGKSCISRQNKSNFFFDYTSLISKMWRLARLKFDWAASDLNNQGQFQKSIPDQHFTMLCRDLYFSHQNCSFDFMWCI